MLNPERGAAAGGSGMIVPAGAPAQEGVSGTKRKGRMPCGFCPLVVSASVCSYLRPGRKRRGGVRPTGVGEPRPVRAYRGASFRVGAPVCVERPAVPDPAEDEPPPKAGGAVLCAGRPLSVGLRPCLSAGTWPLRVLPLRSPSGRCGPRSRIAPCRMGRGPLPASRSDVRSAWRSPRRRCAENGRDTRADVFGIGTSPILYRT